MEYKKGTLDQKWNEHLDFLSVSKDTTIRKKDPAVTLY